jgi:hypothetical protein
MKKTIALLTCVLAIGSAIAQNNNSEEAKSILRLSREKCQSIQQGYYVMERKMKFMSDKDTAAERHTCDFHKLPDDTIYGKAFHMLFEPMDEEETWKGHILYTGREKVWIDDTTAVIQSCDQWADKIIAGRHNQKFYTPLTEENCHPLPGKNWLADSNYIYSLSETLLDGKPCYRVTYFNTNFEPDTVFGITTIRYEVNIWIDKRDYLPVQYTEVYDNVEGQDTTCQYEFCRLLEFSPEVAPSRLTLDAIPANLPRRDYVPYTPPEPLA